MTIPTVGTRVQLRQPHFHAGKMGRITEIRPDAKPQGRYRIVLDDGGITHAAPEHLQIVPQDAVQEPVKPTVWVETPEDTRRIERFMRRSRVKRLQKQLAEARRRGFAKTLVPLDLLEAILREEENV